MRSLVTAALIGGSAGAKWGYNDPSKVGYDASKWHESFPADCAGNSQSPIDVVWPTSSDHDSIPDLKIVFPMMSIRGDVHNNGHTFVTFFDGNETMTGGPLGDTIFRLAQFHFHWGAAGSLGSEHTYNGQQGEMEGHFVFWNTSYSNFSHAASQPQGLSVLGVMYQESDASGALVFGLKGNLQAEGDQQENDLYEDDYGSHDALLATFNFQDWIPATAETHYATYPGSLTTPDCYESVIWLNVRDPGYVQSESLIDLRQLDAATGNASIVNNFRPVQPLNGRVLRFSKAVLDDATSTAVAASTPLFTVLLFAALNMI